MNSSIVKTKASPVKLLPSSTEPDITKKKKNFFKSWTVEKAPWEGREKKISRPPHLGVAGRPFWALKRRPKKTTELVIHCSLSHSASFVSLSGVGVLIAHTHYGHTRGEEKK